MNNLTITSLLLAERSRILDIAHAFRTNQQQHSVHGTLLWLTIVFAVAGALLVLNRLLDRRDQDQRRVNQPLRLFLALCKAHKLKWSERWLLWRVARCQRLRDPGRLFLEPERLDPANLSPTLRLQWAQLRLLRERLFRGLAAEEPSPAALAVAEEPCPPASLDELASGAFTVPLDQSWAISTWSPQAEISTEDTAPPIPS